MSSTIFGDFELGDGLHYASLAGLLLLFVGCVLFFVFYFGYHEAVDNETTTKTDNTSESAKTLEISWITIGGLGYLLCFSIILGHYYKTKNDPRTVVGFNHVFHEMGENLVKVETKLEDNDYLGVASQNSKATSGNFL